MSRPNVRSLGALPTATGGITRLAYAHARDHGVDPDPLLAAAGLSKQQILDRRARIKVRHQIDFLDSVAKAVKDPFLGFHLARKPDLRQLGLLYYVVASSETFGDAWRRGARYTSVTNEGLSLTYLQGREIAMVFDYIAVPRHVDRQQIEFCMTALLHLCRRLTDRELIPLQVAFTHHRNNDPSELSAFFGCRVKFGRKCDCLTFGGDVRHLPIVSAGPYLNDILIANGEEVPARRKNTRCSFRLDVENAMVPLLPHGMARAGEIARRLGVSKRTLARRLSVDGQTFSDILDRLRGELAHQYLADTDLTISQVAWLLGYQEISAFTHAFKRRNDAPEGSRAAGRRAPSAEFTRDAMTSPKIFHARRDSTSVITAKPIAYATKLHRKALSLLWHCECLILRAWSLRRKVARSRGQEAPPPHAKAAPRGHRKRTR